MFAVTFSVSCAYGFGQHNADLVVSDRAMATFWELIGQLAVSLTMGTSKAAGALFLLRILTTSWSVPPNHSFSTAFAFRVFNQPDD